MIVHVFYTVEKTTTIEVDDKYEKILQGNIPWGKWAKLRRELLQDVENSEAIPEDAEVKEISDEKNKICLAVNEENL